MNNKGFTIYELLAVIVIITILGGVIIPVISNYIEDGKNKYNNMLKNQLLLSGKNYYSQNKNKLPTNKSSKTVDFIDSNELATSGYLKGSLKDADEVSCMKKSFVVAVNEGYGVNYFPCLICGNDEGKYMTDDEKIQCNKVYNFDNPNSSDPDIPDIPDVPGGPTGTSGGYPQCEFVADETKFTDEGVQLKIKANDANGYITRVYVVDENGKVVEKLSQNEVNKNSTEIEKIIKFTDFGVYSIFVMDNNNNKDFCTKFNYENKNTTKLDAEMYLVSKEQYELNKNTGISDSQLSGFTKYSGDWTNAYVYVKLSYYDFQYKSMKIGGTDILGKKYFFISKEGDNDTVINAVNFNDQNVEINLNTKIDRTAPEVSLTNSKNDVWTNGIVTVNASFSDEYSQVKTVEYSGGVNWYDSWTLLKSDVATKEWNKENRDTTMYVRAIDNAGNVSETVSTKIKQDVVKPPKPTITNSSSGKWTNASVVVSGSSVDDFSGTDYLQYDVGSGWSKDWTSTSSNNASKTWSNSANRKYTMSLRAVDKAGNVSDSASSNVYIDIVKPVISKHCLAKKEGGKWYFKYTFTDEGGSGVYGYKWGYCYSTCPGCASYLTCSSKSVASRLEGDSWHSATYKQTSYQIAPTSDAKTISVTTRFIVKDNAGNYETYGNYTDTWKYDGSTSPGKC